MTSEQFCYWLQGFVEITGQQPTKKQWQDITNHLKTVFNKVTPDIKKDGEKLTFLEELKKHESEKKIGTSPKYGDPFKRYDPVC